ncbi:response regulator [Geopseudomonas guangdongensis]|uniref:DNA-binding response regulator, NarL/FixJ family, contains REC and HTH domains n=1 Tax=Geopseudomonas guangdongensis TaxID=1245526 RepID=A0A1H2G8M9_9GAMM|nr:response regulator transcription factor [Pseudomonas guangdongensis]SDU16116.1 DNA-binding response regulator, NarL/FixJ family, contains REC and HTH domains [Pseudomonas guangdongensis]
MLTASHTSDNALLPAPVLVVEDDPLMRQRLARVLGEIGYAQEAVSFSVNLAEARAHVSQQPVAMVLVDLGLPDGNGIELIQELRTQDPALWILVISAWSTEDAILGALRAGATGYLLKERDDLEVSLSIRSVLRGGAPIDPFIARRILALLPTVPLQTPSDTSDIEALSARESEILEWVSRGLSNREIAEQLAISRYTVECHIKRIYRKLAVSSRTRALSEARQRGLLP